MRMFSFIEFMARAATGRAARVDPERRYQSKAAVDPLLTSRLGLRMLPGRLLLVSQRFDGVEICGFQGRKEAENHADGSADRKGNQNRLGRDQSGESGEPG